MRPTQAWGGAGGTAPQERPSAPEDQGPAWEGAPTRRARPVGALVAGLVVLVMLGVASRSGSEPAVLGVGGDTVPPSTGQPEPEPGQPPALPAPAQPGPRPPAGAATGAVLPLPAPPILGRGGHVAVASRAGMFVWGGRDGALTFADGALFDLRAGLWREVPSAPITDRADATGVWSGRELLVWGGRNDREGLLGDGAAYDPAATRWRTLPPAPLAPSATHTATWTGRQMVVWGGQANGAGATYIPGDRRWYRLPPAPIAPRSGHSATWTGEEVVIWGGQGTAGVLDDGAAYNPTRRSWRRLPPAPGRSAGHVAVWTGELLVLWGGVSTDPAGVPIAGLLYDPAQERWRVLPEPPAPVGNEPQPHAVWTGTHVVAWSGYPRATGGVFDPRSLTWRPLGTFPGRIGRSAVFTDGEMVVWGGTSGRGATTRGIRFRPDF